MKHNLSPADRLVRIILGLAVAVVGIVYNSWWGLIGIIPLATGLLNFCPLYRILNISTARKQQDQNQPDKVEGK